MAKSKLKPLSYQEARQIKVGQKFILRESKYESKAGDVVRITKAEYPGSDYEHIRISNGESSWRTSTYNLAKLTNKNK